jgi:hypothetical protein
MVLTLAMKRLIVAALAAVTLLFALLLKERDSALGFESQLPLQCIKYPSSGADRLVPPEECLWYFGEDLHKFLGVVGENRPRYFFSLLTKDILFPVSYAVLLVVLVKWASQSRTAAVFQVLLPVLAAASDIAENVLTAAAASRYFAIAPWMIQFVESTASWATLAKWVFLISAVVVAGYRIARR